MPRAARYAGAATMAWRVLPRRRATMSDAGSSPQRTAMSMPLSARSTTSSVKLKSSCSCGYCASSAGTSGSSSTRPVDVLAVMRTAPRGVAAVATVRSSSSRSASRRLPRSYS